MSAGRLDHGVLNIPGRTSGINAELDRFKARERDDARALAKVKAAAHRERQAEAKALVASWDDMTCRTNVARLTREFGHTAKQARKRLNSEAHWAPGNILRLSAMEAAS